MALRLTPYQTDSVDACVSNPVRQDARPGLFLHLLDFDDKTSPTLSLVVIAEGIHSSDALSDLLRLGLQEAKPQVFDKGMLEEAEAQLFVVVLEDVKE